MSELYYWFVSLDPQSQHGVFGIIAVVLGAIMTYFYYRAKAELNEILTVHSYQSGELCRMCSDGFDAIVRIEGKVSCDAPLTSPLMGFECCWYRTKIEREQEHSGRGGQERCWDDCWDETHSTIFKLSDEHGFVYVDPEKSDIQYEEPETEIVDSYQPWFIGVPPSDTGRYRITEMIFLPGGHAYVLGQATCMGDGTEPNAIVHFPKQGYVDPKRKYFLISRRTEDQLIQQEGISLRICLWGGLIAYAFAAYCFLIYLGMLPA